MDLIPKPDQVVSAASNVAHKVLYGGLADLRPMPRTLIDDGTLREVYHYRPAATVKEHRRPGAAGHPARRPRDLLRPAPRLLAGRALRDRRASDVPRGVRRGLLQATATSAWSTGSTRSCRPRSARCPRTPAAGRCTSSAGAWAGSSRCSPRPTSPDLPIASLTARRLADRRVAGAAGRAAAAAAQLVQRPRPAHQGLPGCSAAPRSRGAVGVPAVVVPEAGDQAARAGAATSTTPSSSRRSRPSTGSPTT